MELRQLRYFVAVADELHFGKAAQRLLIAGPSLSQQIKALERDLGVRLLERDRRHVALTAAGRTFLDDARAILAAADTARRNLTGAARSPVRLGYVSWLPPALAPGGPIAGLRIDEWILPSHSQLDRVREGTLDLAIAWSDPRRPEAASALHLVPLWDEPLIAITPLSRGSGSTPASELAVLVDADQTSWASWNAYALAFASHARAAIVPIDDGGIAGPAFFDHVARLDRPVLASPKRHSTPRPPHLATTAVSGPAPLWPWVLARRADEHRPEVLTVADTVIQVVRDNAPSSAHGPSAGTWRYGRRRTNVAAVTPLSSDQAPPAPSPVGWASSS